MELFTETNASHTEANIDGLRLISFGERMKEIRKRKKETETSIVPRFSIKGKVEDCEKSPTLSPPKTRRKKKMEMELESPTIPQYRIVNWGHLCKQLESCTNCDKGPINLQNIVSERRAGLGFISKVECKECNEINEIRTDEIHEDHHKRGLKRSKLNEHCVLGTIHSGNGHKQLEHLLAPMDIHCLHSKSFKTIERRVGKQIERVTESSCKKWLEREIESAEGGPRSCYFI